MTAEWPRSGSVIDEATLRHDGRGGRRVHGGVDLRQRGGGRVGRHLGHRRQVPGTGALNKGGTAALLHSVSCASAGNCGAGGYCTDGSGNSQAFAVGET